MATGPAKEEWIFAGFRLALIHGSLKECSEVSTHVVTQVALFPEDQRLAPARETEPEFFSLNADSMNFGIFSRASTGFLPTSGIRIMRG